MIQNRVLDFDVLIRDDEKIEKHKKIISNKQEIIRFIMETKVTEPFSYQTLNESLNTSNRDFESRLDIFSSSPYVTGLLVVVAFVMSFVTIIGNLLVISAFIIEKKLQKYSNYFILNLSIADLLIGFLIPTYVIMNMYGDSKFKSFACTIWLVLDYVAGSASVLCIVVISLDRYLLVSRGLTYLSNQKVFNASMIIFTVWGIY